MVTRGTDTISQASGNIGSIITKHLLSTGIFQVSALTRESSTSTFPPEVTPVRVPSYEFSHLKAAFEGQDIVVCTISTSSLGDQFAIAKAVVEAGVKRFIPAELGMDSSSESVLQVAPCMFLKRDVVKYLREHEDTTSWTGIFCGLWIDFVSVLQNSCCIWTSGLTWRRAYGMPIGDIGISNSVDSRSSTTAILHSTCPLSIKRPRLLSQVSILTISRRRRISLCTYVRQRTRRTSC